MLKGRGLPRRMKSGKVLDCCLERRRTAMRKKKEKKKTSLGIASYMGFAPSEATDKRRDPEWKKLRTPSVLDQPVVGARKKTVVEKTEKEA